MVDNDWKLVYLGKNKQKEPKYELDNLTADPKGENDLYNSELETRNRMMHLMAMLNNSIQVSVQGSDYPEGKLNPSDPKSRFWMEVDTYKPFFEQWKDRPEYKSRLNPKTRKKQPKSSQTKGG